MQYGGRWPRVVEMWIRNEMQNTLLTVKYILDISYNHQCILLIVKCRTSHKEVKYPKNFYIDVDMVVF